MAWSGIGVGDIVAGIKIAWKIYDTGFVEENRADVRYRNFRNDIQGFAQLLEQLNKALGNAHLRFTQRSLTVKAAGCAYDPLSNDFDEERRHLIGNFTATLKECDRVLEQNKSLHINGSTPFGNIKWDLLTESKILDLRKRIEFHSSKILLVIDRLSLDLLTDLDAKVDDLTGLVEQNLAVSREIQLLLRKFYDSWNGNRPQVLDPALEDRHVASSAIQQRLIQQATNRSAAKSDIVNFPRHISLPDAFDALLLHFEKSLEETEKNQTPDQYLSLLKARWLVENIQESQEYKDARPGFYYKRAVARIEQAILVRVRSNAVIKFDDEVLLALPNSSFSIWNRPEQHTARQDPTMARANEREIIRLDLVSDGVQSQDKVTILQRSDNQFRIVMESLAEDGKIFMDKTFFAHDDKLIPRYALPSLSDRRLELAIFSRNEESLYRFHRMSDVFLFQSVLMGYHVAHHQRGVECGFSETALNCNGDIQIWQDPIDSKLSQNSLSAPSSPLTSSSSVTGASSNARQPSIAASTRTTTVGRVQDGYQARRISYPAITIFTKLEDRQGRSRFALIYLKLDRDIRLFTEQCGCGDEATYNECPLLSIERPKQASFPVYVLFSDLDKTGQPNPNSWDLSPFRIPQHPKFKQLQKIESTYLLLRFSSLSAKKKFHKELNERFELREAQKMEQIRFLAWMMHRQDRPSRITDSMPHPRSRTASFADASPTATREAAALLAKLEELDLGTDFQSAFEEIYGAGARNSDSDEDDDPTPVASQILQRRSNSQCTSPVSPLQSNMDRAPTYHTTASQDIHRRYTDASIASTSGSSKKRSSKILESFGFSRKKG